MTKTMVTKTIPPCPACGKDTLQSHCHEGHPTCRWWTCMDQACDVNVDKRNLRYAERRPQ